MKGPVGFGVKQDGNFGLLGVFVMSSYIDVNGFRVQVD